MAKRAPAVLVALVALAAGTASLGAQASPPRDRLAPDTSGWSETTRQLWREALAYSAQRNGMKPQRLRDDSIRLAALDLRTVAVPGFTLRVAPNWEAAADSALRSLSTAIRDVQPIPPLVMAAVPATQWPVPVRDDRMYATPAGPIYFLPSGGPSSDTLVTLANRVLADALKARLMEAAAGNTATQTSPAGRDLADYFAGITPGQVSVLHRRAGEALRASGREGWRECAAGDDAMCLRALLPTPEDSVSRFFGPRDYRAHVLRDTFPLDVGMKRRCRAGDDAACLAWVRKYELVPDLTLPREAMMSLTAMALRTQGALPRLQAPASPGMRPGPVAALVATSGLPPEALARAWRDSLVAAQRHTHDADGRTALLAAPWLLLFGLLAIGGRRDAK